LKKFQPSSFPPPCSAGVLAFKNCRVCCMCVFVCLCVCVFVCDFHYFQELQGVLHVCLCVCVCVQLTHDVQQGSPPRAGPALIVNTNLSCNQMSVSCWVPESLFCL
jgi:hypothetical protein